MSANLCLESHLRTLLERGFEVAVVQDATAAATLPDDIRRQITRERRTGDPNAAVDPMADPAVRAAIDRARFEVLLGFQLDPDQLRYNAMLISVFELLADAREQVMSVNASINALRDFWLAETDLQIAINGSSTAMGRGATRAAAALGVRGHR